MDKNNSVDSGVINFTILGLNPVRDLVLALIQPLQPAYFAQMLRQESAFHQFYGAGAISNAFDSKGTAGFPFVTANPDGIGIGQWDGIANRTVRDDDYWSTGANIADNSELFEQKKRTARNDYKAMFDNAVANGYPPPVHSVGSCTFSYPGGNGAYDYLEAQDIQNYNTRNIAFASVDSFGNWSVNDTQYTGKVCRQPGL